MLQLISRRILFILLVYLAIIFFTHLGMRMTRNSELPEPNFDIRAYIQPAWDDTRTYLGRTLSGNLGNANDNGRFTPITTILRTSYINSLGLLTISLTTATILGLLLGIFLTITHRASLALTMLTFTIIGVSAPAFFCALLLQLGAIEYAQTFTRQLVKMSGFGWDYQHMLMPVLVLTARPLAYLTRTTFLSLRRVLDQDYIRTAHAKGLRQSRILNLHALTNIAVPFLTAVGVSLRFSLSTLPVVEFFFLWPGLGLRLLQAIDQRQTAVVVTLATALGLTILIINLLLDIAYWLIDPRIREAQTE
ncbi:MAG TPA: ABC transporter permease [Anaerolineae bacterium]|nr:ABC transporter permease [Anaerolineae bacterium]